MNEYYQVLGLSSTATVEQVKKTYRRKAKELHPDVNPSPNAHIEFIRITEAYQFILNHKTKYRHSFDSSQTKQKTETYEDFVRRRQKEARIRAKRAAQMKHEEFIKSPLYKSALKVMKLIDVFYVILGVFVIIMPIFNVLYFGIDEEDIAVNIVAIIFCVIFGGSLIYFVVNSSSDFNK